MTSKTLVVCGAAGFLGEQLVVELLGHRFDRIGIYQQMAPRPAHEPTIPQVAQ